MVRQKGNAPGFASKISLHRYEQETTTVAHTQTVIRKHALPRPFEAPAEIRVLLRSIGTRETIPAKTVLFRTGDPPKGVFLVLRGKVALSAGSDQSPLTRIAGQGSLLGLPSTVGKIPYSLNAEALSNVEVCLVQAEPFRKLLASNPVLGMAIVNILSNEVSALRRFMS
jgi:CRP-like cAMP-binding protein